MFLHIGGDVSIPLGDVVAIIDAQSKRRASTTRAFLEKAGARGQIKEVGDGVVNAYVVTDRYIYASPISSVTLKRRSEAGYLGVVD